MFLENVIVPLLLSLPSLAVISLLIIEAGVLSENCFRVCFQSPWAQMYVCCLSLDGGVLIVLRVIAALVSGFFTPIRGGSIFMILSRCYKDVFCVGI